MTGKNIKASALTSESTPRNDEVNLINISRIIWRRKRLILVSIAIFAFIGLFIAIFSKKEFTASTTMVPQVNNSGSKLGGLSSLASLAGFNIDMQPGNYNISPVLYPKIVSSTSFQLEIMNSEFLFEELDRKISLFEYYNSYYQPGVLESLEKYTFGLPGIILEELKRNDENEISYSSSNDSGPLKLTREQDEVREILDKRLNLVINDEEGYLKLVSRFHQPEFSAQVAIKAQELLQKYITDFKIEKAEAQYEFIQERYFEKKKEFEAAQNQLAQFRDKNKNINSAILRTREEQLENEYQLAFEVYSELAGQLEQAKIKVKEDTPVFSVIEEVFIPTEKSKPQRLIIIIVSLIIGTIIGVFWVLAKTFYSSLTEIN